MSTYVLNNLIVSQPSPHAQSDVLDRSVSGQSLYLCSLPWWHCLWMCAAIKPLWRFKGNHWDRCYGINDIQLRSRRCNGRSMNIFIIRSMQWSIVVLPYFQNPTRHTTLRTDARSNHSRVLRCISCFNGLPSSQSNCQTPPEFHPVEF